MIEFSSAIHASWVLSGYTHAIYLNVQTHALLKPLLYPIPDDIVDGMGAVIYSLADEEILMFAEEDAVGGFKVYVSDEAPIDDYK